MTGRYFCLVTFFITLGIFVLLMLYENNHAKNQYIRDTCCEIPLINQRLFVVDINLDIMASIAGSVIAVYCYYLR